MTMTLTMIFPLTLILTLILTLTYTDTDTDTDTEFFFHGWGWGAVFRSFSVFLQKQAASVPHVQCIALFGRERGKTETRRETERGSERDTERETETDREVQWKNNNSCLCHRILMLSVHITPCPCSDLVTPKIRGCSLI